MAKLAGGVVVINSKVSGSSEVKIDEKKDSYDDALSAALAAVEEALCTYARDDDVELKPPAGM